MGHLAPDMRQPDDLAPVSGHQQDYHRRSGKIENAKCPTLFYAPELRDRGVDFRSIQDGAIDTTTASGELMFMIFSALAQFERRLIQERTRAGLAAARARGRSGGRPRMKTTDPIVKMAKELHQNPELSISEVCQTLKISRATFYRYLAMSEAQQDTEVS